MEDYPHSGSTPMSGASPRPTLSIECRVRLQQTWYATGLAGHRHGSRHGT